MIELRPEDRERLVGQLRYMLYAERVTRILCRRSGLVEGYRWSAASRRPPLPFWEQAAVPGSCRVCGQPIYGGGSFRSFAGERSKRLTWHSACTATYFLWMKAGDYANVLAFRQDFVCAASGDPLAYPIRGIEVDHEVPLYRVRRDHAGEPWFDLLRFWGFANLRAITRAAHVAKCCAEARERAGARSAAATQGAFL